MWARRSDLKYDLNDAPRRNSLIGDDSTDRGGFHLGKPNMMNRGSVKSDFFSLGSRWTQEKEGRGISRDEPPRMSWGTEMNPGSGGSFNNTENYNSGQPLGRPGERERRGTSRDEPPRMSWGSEMNSGAGGTFNNANNYNSGQPLGRPGERDRRGSLRDEPQRLMRGSEMNSGIGGSFMDPRNYNSGQPLGRPEERNERGISRDEPPRLMRDSEMNLRAGGTLMDSRNYLSGQSQGRPEERDVPPRMMWGPEMNPGVGGTFNNGNNCISGQPLGRPEERGGRETSRDEPQIIRGNEMNPGTGGTLSMEDTRANSKTGSDISAESYSRKVESVRNPKTQGDKPLSGAARRKRARENRILAERAARANKIRKRENNASPSSQKNTKKNQNETAEQPTTDGSNPTVTDNLKKLAIIKDGQPKELDDKEAVLVQQKILELMDAIPDGDEVPRFQDSYYTKGVLKVTCEKEEAEKWLREKIPTLCIGEDIKLKVMTLDEIPKSVRVVGYFRESNTVETPTILKRLERQNTGLVTEGWTVFERSNEGKRIRIVLGVTEEAIQVFKNSKLKPFYGLGRATFVLNRKEVWSKRKENPTE